MPVRLTLASRNAPDKLPGVIAAQALGASDDGWQDWDIKLAPGGSAADLLEHITGQGFALRRFEQQRPSLHDVFVHIVGAPEEPK